MFNKGRSGYKINSIVDSFVNINKINEIGLFSISDNISDSISIYTDSGCTSVRETPAEVLELIRKKTKENEKN